MVVLGIEITITPALFEQALRVSARGAYMIFGHGAVEDTFLAMTSCEYVHGVSDLITLNANYFSP